MQEQKNNFKVIADRMFGAIEDETDACSKNNVVIRNNLETIKSTNTTMCDDDGYDAGF